MVVSDVVQGQEKQVGDELGNVLLINTLLRDSLSDTQYLGESNLFGLFGGDQEGIDYLLEYLGFNQLVDSNSR
jgi:hypothetical protein